jgi:hypothetical protein
VKRGEALGQVSRVACGAHGQSRVVKYGTRLAGRRQRYLCRPIGEEAHTFTAPVTEELLGTCLTCHQAWEKGHAVPRRSRFLLDHVLSFVFALGRGASMAQASQQARWTRDEFRVRSAAVNGRHHQSTPLSRDGRLAADWLERFGAPIVGQLLPRSWPAATVMVDAKAFKVSARYPADHPTKAGHPLFGGKPHFAVLVAGTRGAAGSLRIIHIRATPNDDKPSWEDFFRSLPGRPAAVLSDPDPQIAYALHAVWPQRPPTHLISLWHYYDNVREKFINARRYPNTDPLCHDADAAFRNAGLFRSWRDRAMREAPLPVQAWLAKKGDEVLARLETAAPPLAFGDLETFLTRRIGFALEAGHPVIRNLRRLDIRLGLIALDHNRTLVASRMQKILVGRLTASPDNKSRRLLDGVRYEAGWLFRERRAS